MSPAVPAKQWNQAVRSLIAGAILSMRAIAHAAPKPLSMPTTVMPLAHDGVHRQQRGHAVERRAVADAGRHGDDGRAR